MMSTRLLWLFNSAVAVRNQKWTIFVQWAEINVVFIVLISIPLDKFSNLFIHSWAVRSISGLTLGKVQIPYEKGVSLGQ